MVCGWIYITRASQDKLDVYVMREENTLVPQPTICSQQITNFLSVWFNFSVQRGEALFQSRATQCEDHRVEQALPLLRVRHQSDDFGYRCGIMRNSPLA